MYKVITNQDDKIYVTEDNEMLALNVVTTDELDDAIESLGSTFQNNLNAHINDFENPHRVTKSQVGLADVDNTSDLNKPISTATQQAITNEIDRATSVEKSLQQSVEETSQNLQNELDKKINISTSDTTQNIYNHIYNNTDKQMIISSVGTDFDPMSEEELQNLSYSSYFFNNPMMQLIQNTFKDNEGNQTITSISQSTGAIILQTQSQNGSSMINIGDGVTQIGDGSDFYNFRNTSLNSTNNADLGTSTNKFKDLYLSGKLSDGTNEVTIGDINNKVDKVEGKGLSTEDFTTALKEKLESIDTSGGSSGGSGTVIQKNYLYNQEFTINQREKTLYPVGTADSYCVDRWQKGADVEVTYTNSTSVTTISNKSTTQLEGITQYIADDTTLLGKQVTFTVKTTEGTYSMTTDPLPLTPKKTHKNTIIQTQNTSFGALQIEFAKTHFLVRILINPATSDTDYTTITPVYAKLELGVSFTGIDYKDKYSYLQECSQFYQKNPFRTLYTHGYYVRYSTYTQYFATCPLGTNFYSSTLKFEIKDGSHPKLLTNENGISDLVYDSVATTLKGPDKSVVAISMTINEDNSAILGDKTSKYELCMFSFPNSSIDGEITS